MCLMGAEILFYPSAIGSEPQDKSIDSRPHWQTTMQGHAAANITPLVACNRIGKEDIEDSSITFYGSSFITNQWGTKVCEASKDKEEVLVAEFNLAKIRSDRISWGLFR